jgi:hypothetical protein
MTKTSKRYDGFYFAPIEDEDSEQEDLKLTFFELLDDDLLNEPTEKHSLGNTFLMIFFKTDDEGMPFLDEITEAILSDPEVYIQNIVGTGLFGCIVRKTPRALKFVDEYIKSSNRIFEKLRLDESFLDK